MLKVQVISKETIKPSSPTPKHLHSVPLSLVDQLAPTMYIQVLLFYSGGDDVAAAEKAFRLKDSLSETLTHYYPLAGRIRGAASSGGVHVECNDEGAEFSEARVEGELDSVLRQPPMGEFNLLLPNNGADVTYGDPLLAVQFNVFECGAAALGICISHQIADGSSMTLFLNSWADVARGKEVSSPPRFDSASVFPPINLRQAPEFESFTASGIIAKRFIIKGPEIEKLRGNKAYARTQFPTRVEAVSTLVWRCAVRARAKTARETIPVAMHVVNLRKKMAGQLTDRSFGNLWTYAAVMEDGVGRGFARDRQAALEENMRSGVRGVDGEYARAQIEEQISGQNPMEGGGEANNFDAWIFSSWCRFSLYETDFGWGEPAWLCCALRDMKNVGILTDTKDGDGIEVWIWLEQGEMERLEKDPELLEFAVTQQLDLID